MEDNKILPPGGTPAPQSRFLNPYETVERTRHHLPHWEQNGVACFVTFRLADSLPKDKLDLWRKEKETYLSQCDHPLTPEQEKEFHKRFSSYIDKYLDNGHGACSLRSAKIAKIVSDAFRYFDGQRYFLYSFVIMPNHVHILFSAIGKEKVPDIVHSWKSYTAKLANRELEMAGSFWQEDYWDRMIRSQKHFDFVIEYIKDNPVKAKLKDGEFIWEAK